MIIALTLILSLISLACIPIGGWLLTRIAGNRLAGLLYITTALLWLSVGAPILVALALGLAAVELARHERWGWAGWLAGLAAILDPGGMLLVGLLLLLALRAPSSLWRCGRATLIPTLVGLLLSGLLVRAPAAVSLSVLLTLAPLSLIALFGWLPLRNQSLRHESFAALIVAWGALDTLVRVVILHQPPTPLIVPGLALLVATIHWPRVQHLALISNGVLLAISLGLPLTVPYSAISLPVDGLTPRSVPVAITYTPDLSLVGVAIDQNAGAGQLVRLQFDWEVRVAPAAPLMIQIDLLNAAHQSVVSRQEERTLTQGRVTTQHRLTMPSLPPGVLNVYVTVTYKAARLGQQPVARVIVPLGGHSEGLRVAQYPNGSLFLRPTYSTAPNQLTVTLPWRSAGGLERDYKFFLHVQSEVPQTDTQSVTGTQPVAQHDAEPLNGNYPTSLWQPGDVIRDSVPLDLANAPPGNYALWFGMYTDDSRLPMRDCANQTVDQLRLATLRLMPDRSVTVEQQAPGC